MHVEWNVVSERCGVCHWGSACAEVLLALCAWRCCSVEMRLLSPPPAYLNPIILGSSIFTVKLCDPGQISTLSELVCSSVKQMVEGVIYAHSR